MIDIEYNRMVLNFLMESKLILDNEEYKIVNYTTKAVNIQKDNFVCLLELISKENYLNLKRSTPDEFFFDDAFRNYLIKKRLKINENKRIFIENQDITGIVIRKIRKIKLKTIWKDI
jgi:hypothetical protein